MLATKAEADRDGVKVPLTLQDYCITSKTNSSAASASADIDFYNDDDDYVDDDEEVETDDDNGQCADCEGDSGHGDS